MFTRSLYPNNSPFTQRVFTQNWLNSFWTMYLYTRPNCSWIAVTYSVSPFISLNTQSDDCNWRRMFLLSRNVYKCTQVACSVVVVCFIRFLSWTSLLVVYSLISLLYARHLGAYYIDELSYLLNINVCCLGHF